MASTSNQSLAAGTAVGGHYVIERHLRNGVNTEVDLARREGGGRERFEVRRFSLVASANALKSVRTELERIQDLRLPAIPTLVDVIDDPVGLLVVTAQAGEGAVSLRQRLDASGPVEPGDGVRVVRAVGRVLDALHRLTPPVLHRRLSPDTVTLVGAEPDVRVEECGLAQALVDAGLLNARVPLQARQYLSPDELLQRPSPRGDVFALASLAFEVLTGRVAFQGATEASLSASILRGARPSASAVRASIPAALDAVLARAWSADASKGFPSAGALAEALVASAGQPIPRRTPSAMPRTEPAAGTPIAGVNVLTSGELNVMKATILGIGAPAAIAGTPVAGGAPVASPTPGAPRPGGAVRPARRPDGSAPVVTPPTGASILRRPTPPSPTPVVSAAAPPTTLPTPVAPGPAVPVVRAVPVAPPTPTEDEPLPPVSLLATPLEPSGPFSGPVIVSRTKTVGGRVQMSTQRVDVPRIHLPGTERVGPEAERGAGKGTPLPGPLPDASPKPREIAPAEPPAAVEPAPAPMFPPAPPMSASRTRSAESDLFAMSDLEGFDIPLAPEGTPVSDPAPRRSVPPPPIPDQALAAPKLPTADGPRPSVPSSRPSMDFEMDAEIPASAVDDGFAQDVTEVSDSAPPPAPPAPPAPPVATAPIVAPPPAPPPPPPPSMDTLVARPPTAEPSGPTTEHSVPVIAILSEAPGTPALGTPMPPSGAFSPPPPPSGVDMGAFLPTAPAMPAMAPLTPDPYVDPVSIPPAIAPRDDGPPSVPGGYAVMPRAAPMPPFQPPPEAPSGSDGMGRVKILGGAIIAAAVIVTAGQIYLARAHHDEASPAPLPPVVVVPRPPVRPAAVDAGSPVVDRAAPSVDAAVSVDAARVAVADAGVTAGAADAAAVVAEAASDAGTTPAPTGTPGWNVDVFGATNDPPARHPHRGDVGHLKSAMEPAIRACAAGTSGHRVRVNVLYEGRTGRPTEIHIFGAFGQPPASDCIERVLRANPVPPFTDDDFGTSFNFSLRGHSDDEE